jgi:predicted RND superfamily exporter protein
MFTTTKKHRRSIIIVFIVILLMVVASLYLLHQEATAYDTASLIPKAGEILKNFKTDGKIYCHIEGFHNKRYIVCGTSNIHNILTFIK